MSDALPDLDRQVDRAMDEGADWASARYVERRERHLQVVDGVLRLRERTSSDVSIRVLDGGAEGYVSTSATYRAALDAATTRAASAARVSAAMGASDASTPSHESIDDTWDTSARHTPDLDDLAAMALELDSTVAGVDGICARRTRLRVQTRTTHLRTSAGSSVSATDHAVQLRVMVEACDSARRRIGRSTLRLGRSGSVASLGGLEHLTARVSELATGAAGLRDAEPAPTGVRPVVLDGAAMTVLVHETLGIPLLNPAGAERVLGGRIGEALLASTVSLTAEPRRAGALGAYGHDDEGGAATSTTLVEDGRFVGTLADLPTRRSFAPDRPPRRSVPPLSLGTGRRTRRDLVATGDDAVWLEGATRWWLSPTRETIILLPERVRMSDGSLRRPVALVADVRELWGTCSALADDQSEAPAPTPDADLGWPTVSHAVPPARFEEATLTAPPTRLSR